MARSIVDICNEALGEVPAELISDIDDDSLMSARHCKRLLPNVISDCLEFHDYDFATWREALAQVVNDRAGEWLYAYALPSNIRSPKSILPTYAATGASVMGGLSVGTVGQFHDSIPYVIAGGKLYTNLENAVLEFTRDNIPVTEFTAMFARVVALTLASRLVMPLNPDRARQNDLIRMAEVAQDRAIADDANRNRDDSLDFVSERAMARGVDGFSAGFYRGIIR